MQTKGKPKSIYAGFWLRVGASLLDVIYTLPLIFSVQYLNGLGKNMYYYTCIPLLLFTLWYNTYLPKRYGGTPGQLSARITILRSDMKTIGWREAILRYMVLGVLNIAGIIITILAIQKANDDSLATMNWLQQSRYMMMLMPVAYKIYSWGINIWLYSDLFALLFNKRKRGLNDFIAGTVVVKKKYMYEINEDVNAEINTIGSAMGVQQSN